MTDLAQLIGWLEAASEGSRELDDAICGVTGGASRPAWVITAPVTTSLDAIVALIARKLPGWGWAVGKRPSEGGWARVFRPTGPEVYVEASTPALALCIAFLKAMEQADG